MIFQSAARAIDLWLLFVRASRRVWAALPGDVLGYMVMRCSGIAAPIRVVQAAGVTALVVEDARTSRYLDTGFMPIYAQTLGRYVFCRARLDPATLAHECEHIRQWRRLGPLFLPLYFGASATAVVRRRRAYWDNAFEVAARRKAESNPDGD